MKSSRLGAVAGDPGAVASNVSKIELLQKLKAAARKWIEDWQCSTGQGRCSASLLKSLGNRIFGL